jgi:hypothetical protein
MTTCHTGNKKLEVFQFKESLSLEQIEKIGRDYIHANFCPPRKSQYNVTSFCKTKDSKWVFFKADYMKLLGKKVNGIRVCEPSRVRRLHWIVPIIKEEAGERVHFGNFKGDKLEKMGHKAIPSSTYRIYWVPAKSYVVFLVSQNSGSKIKSFNLVSAYRVSEAETRIMLETLFPK